ncbi:TetR family transcriptional regulator C-terminal domain-containing protein [Novosphingobium sp. 1949]|uniref:TetR family transcriptional regulator C-terminal domain-containing protein n=1 Tax=Novosphingobium organovorum TaxID=2930092 RepID=A0ABT0BAC4_9SPHN|nr:TetR family transcriptional regulator C-terminal domain-containing protein [Novosphingobium organovorum]MCJ2181978.1 TetR family transcriptional regulator C-terminal domain-containing protein [Novosphingobium organovorum]
MSTPPRAQPQAGTTPPRRIITRQDPGTRRQDLLQVTVGCLARLGPQGTTGREICRQAGVSHGLLRHYFANPQNLLLETYEEVCRQVIARLRARLDEDADAADAWGAMDRFLETLFAPEAASSDMLGAWLAFWSLVRANPEFTARNEAFNAELRALLRTAMDRLIPCGARAGTADDPSLGEVQAIMTAIINGLWLEVCLSPDSASRERAIARCKTSLRRLLPAA